MNEIINHIEEILKSYNITLSEFNKKSNFYLIAGKSDSHKLRIFIDLKYKLHINKKDAEELELLFLTYNYMC